MECGTCKHRNEETKECRALPPDSLITSFTEKTVLDINKPKQYKVTYAPFYKRVKSEMPACSFYKKT